MNSIELNWSGWVNWSELNWSGIELGESESNRIQIESNFQFQR
jgi:hypothetical protein